MRTRTHARTHTTTAGAGGGGGDFLVEGGFTLSVHASVLLGYFNPSCSGENSHMSDLFFQEQWYESTCHEVSHNKSMTTWTERERR
jgi:hypothetical protein